MQDVDESIQIQEKQWTPISKLKVESKSVNVRFSVIKKGKTRQVTAKATGRIHLINNCIVGDESAIIILTLWNNEIDNVEAGKTYELLNGCINIYDECMSLAIGRWGNILLSDSYIVKVNDSIDMSRPFMGRPKRRKQRRSPTGRSFQGTTGRETKGYCSRKGF